MAPLWPWRPNETPPRSDRCVECNGTKKVGAEPCGSCSWPAPDSGRSTVEMICLEDDEEGEHVCYLPLGHDGEHVWTPFGNGSLETRP